MFLKPQTHKQLAKPIKMKSLQLLLVVVVVLLDIFERRVKNVVKKRMIKTNL